MNDSVYFHYPDGTDKTTAPADGEVCRVPSHKRGKFTDYVWDETEGEWFIQPKNTTPDAIVDKAKEILQIGKYYNKRPKKSYGPGTTYWDDIFPYSAKPVGPYAHSGYDLMSGHMFDESDNDPVAIYQRSALQSAVHPQVSVHQASDNGTWFVPCECGAIYTTNMHSHSTWCPRHPNYSK
jgi:hypothetical protein